MRNEADPDGGVKALVVALPAAVRTVLIDTNQLFREGIKLILGKLGYEMVAEAPDVESFAEKIGTNAAPDLILLRLGAITDESSAIVMLRSACPRAKIVAYADADICPSRLMRSFETGLDGYVLPDASAAVLDQSLQLVMLGEKVFPAECAIEWLTSGDNLTAIENPRPEELSQRDVEVLRFLAGGFPNKEIARALNVAEGTVKGHLKILLRKIGAGNRTQAAIWAINHGLKYETRMRGSA
ncbi:MAG TPA: response regulator transcription factor [Alphaproteobacteria bacterium]|nr:response regulator transcription factor [Alphaproteobacteria bacterium]